jgi:hypothetical protein
MDKGKAVKEALKRVINRRGSCYGCSYRFTDRDVPKYVRTQSGSWQKFCRSCNNRMGNIADVPKNVIKEQEQREKRRVTAAAKAKKQRQQKQKQWVDQSQWW